MQLGHIGIPVADLEKSRRFYDAITPHVDLEFLDASETSARYGEDGSARFYVHTRAAGVTNVHVCFDVASQAAVDAFYAAGLAAGGTDHGAPGIRADYSPTYYAAFLLDPDRNNIEAVFRG